MSLAAEAARHLPTIPYFYGKAQSIDEIITGTVVECWRGWEYPTRHIPAGRDWSKIELVYGVTRAPAVPKCFTFASFCQIIKSQAWEI
jgi:hypothetical protein